MSKEIVEIFSSIYEKQDILSKLTANELIDEYGYSEIHCIDCIGKQKEMNVTKIANALNMTRGAISKITKKQIEKGLIKTYSKENNKKEFYFLLTDKGQKIYKEHNKRHAKWLKRDQQFFDNYNAQDLIIIEKFLTTFEQYLYNKIEELTRIGE